MIVSLDRLARCIIPLPSLTTKILHWLRVRLTVVAARDWFCCSQLALPSSRIEITQTLEGHMEELMSTHSFLENKLHSYFFIHRNTRSGHLSGTSSSLEAASGPQNSVAGTWSLLAGLCPVSP